VARVRGQTTRVVVTPNFFDDGPETAFLFPALDDEPQRLIVKRPQDIDAIIRVLNGWKPS
jgi:hypothetical protein